MIGGEQPWSPLIGQDCARGCPLLAPRGNVVHHQHERLEHAHVLLPLGDQVGLKVSTKFRGNFNKDP